MFPFVLKNVTYDGCTTEMDPENKYWCSTKTDKNHNHDGGKGNFGYCPDDCKKAHGATEVSDRSAEKLLEENANQGKKIQELIYHLFMSQVTHSFFTECITSSGKPCMFPFIFMNVTYDGCTTEMDPDKKYWCSTLVDDKQFHEGGGKGNFGYCPDDCKKSEGVPVGWFLTKCRYHEVTENFSLFQLQLQKY